MKYKCTICGYTQEFEEEIPADFVCPICAVNKDCFEIIK